jgi:hypothetical protein
MSFGKTSVLWTSFPMNPTCYYFRLLTYDVLSHIDKIKEVQRNFKAERSMHPLRRVL